MAKKEREFALPDSEKNDYEKECFQAMSDTLYTYLYYISKHRPDRYPDGTFVENWNYIYIDANKEKGYPRYNAAEVQRELKISKTTYYKRLAILKKYRLIEEAKDEKGRRIFKIPFIQSKMILPVKTCQFFTQAAERKQCPEDIIKLTAVLKIYYYSRDQYFTMRQLRLQMGYASNHNNKDKDLRTLLIILRGFGIIDWEYEEIQLSNNRTEIRYYITKFDDSYNTIMDGYSKDAEFELVQNYTEEEKKKLFAIE